MSCKGRLRVLKSPRVMCRVICMYIVHLIFIIIWQHLNKSLAVYGITVPFFLVLWDIGVSWCIHAYRFQNVFLRCPTPRLHCYLSSHWPSFRFLSFMAFLRSKLILPRKFSLGLYRFAKVISLSNNFPPYVSYRYSAACWRGSVWLALNKYLWCRILLLLAFGIQSNPVITTSVYATDFQWHQLIRYC